MASVASAMRLAVENERLAAEVEAQLGEVRASRARIVAAGDAERKRVERDLHDGAQQRLVSLTLALRLARLKLGDDADPAVRESLEQASEEARAALSELRELARGIHPQILTEAGLGSAIQSLADRSPVRVDGRRSDGRALLARGRGDAPTSSCRRRSRTSRSTRAPRHAMRPERRGPTTS